MSRAEERATAYREIAQEKIQVETKLKQKEVSLDKAKKKLLAFQKKADSLQNLRRQLHEAVSRADDLEHSVTELKKERDQAANR